MRFNIIKIKIKEIQESLKIIEENLPEDVEDFCLLGLVKDGIYKRLEFCIENLIDICAVINTDLELGIPESDENIINNLVNKKIVSKDLGCNLKAMRGFRNILVHRYGKIDDELAFNTIKNHFGDFDDFINEIEVFISK